MPNTTATTSSQIILPGLEASIANIMTPIVGTTNTAIANLSTSLNTNITSLSPKIATPNISRDNIYVSDSNTFKYLKDLNCFDTIQYVHIKNFKDDDIIEFKYKNEYDENFNKISTIYMGTIAGIGFNHKVN